MGRPPRQRAHGKNTGVVMYIDSVSAEDIAERAAALVGEDADGLCLMLAEQGAEPEKVVAALKRRLPAFCGAVFPGLLDGGRVHPKGAMAFTVRSAAPPILIPDMRLSSIGSALDPILAANPAPPLTLLLFLDGLASGIPAFLDDLYDMLGGYPHYLGGGAGSMDFVQRPCVFSQDGLLQNAAVILPALHASTLGVRHGWTRLKGPFVVTRASPNWIEELNWTPAFEVYASALSPHLGARPTHDMFQRIAMLHPFGMLREGAEDIVRDPIAVNDRGAIRVVSDVPENAVVNILQGTPESLISAAEQASEEGLAPHPQPRLCLVMDCVSRSICLGDAFERETETIRRTLARRHGAQGCGGALTLGEISTRGHDVLEFLNKTLVVGSLYNAD